MEIRINNISHEELVEIGKDTKEFLKLMLSGEFEDRYPEMSKVFTEYGNKSLVYTMIDILDSHFYMNTDDDSIGVIGTGVTTKNLNSRLGDSRVDIDSLVEALIEIGMIFKVTGDVLMSRKVMDRLPEVEQSAKELLNRGEVKMATTTVTKLFIGQIDTLKNKVIKLDEAMVQNKKVHDDLWDTTSRALLNNVEDEVYNETLQLIQDSYEATQAELEQLQDELATKIEDIAEDIKAITQ